MKQIFNIFLIFYSFCLFSQVNDDFSDGNFTENPTWMGDDSVFVVVEDAGNLKLRSNKLVANSSFYLSTPSSLVSNSQWEFNVRLTFNPSSANYVDVFLNANQPNLLATTLTSYFVRLGGTSDEISLFKRINGVDTKIIDGQDAVLNTSNNNVKVKVTCSATSEWTLERDMTGVGNAYFLEGSVNDNSILTGSHFGFFIRQSTASFFQRHFFDNVYVGPIILDTEAPTIVFATNTGANSFDILFSEPVLLAESQNLTNYSLSPNPVLIQVERDANNFALVHCTVALAFTNGTTYTVTVNNVSDLSGNAMENQSAQFTYIVPDIPLPGEVIITEFMADPSPVLGLPEVEFVEIYNKSNKFFQVNGWKLADNSSQGTIQNAWLYPGQYLVLCPTSSVSLFENAVGVTSFAALNNANDDITLIVNEVIIDHLSYTDAWYKDDVKKVGGYTLERINLNHPCSGSENWIASNDASGGTPGYVNSVNSDLPDTIHPFFEKILAFSPNKVQFTFNELLDSTMLMNAVFQSNPALNVVNKEVSSSFSNQLTLTFQENLIGSQLYTFSLGTISDCFGNEVDLQGEFALTEEPEIGDLIINEILFNVLTGGSDFVELKNISQKLINLNGLEFANLSNGMIANKRKINLDYILKPTDLVIATADSIFQKNNYPATIPGKFIQMTLPTYSNDGGNVIILNDTTVLDQVDYNKSWHFKLIDDQKGKSLERIDPTGNSNDPKNWHTAAEAIGFATPGAENSQYYPGQDLGEFEFTSQTFSPDQDGFEDVLQINYKMTEPSLIGTMTIYDDRGRLVKNLIKNELLGIQGNVIWDGINEQNTKASIGTYVLIFEAFQIEGGAIFTKKKAFVLAGKL
jgi:hypothetical protein